MKHLKLLIAILSFFLIPTGFYLIVKKRNSRKIQWYSVSHPVKRNITKYVNASGSLKAQDQVTVGSLVAGRVEKLEVDDNDFVKKDQVLAVLDDGIGDSAVKLAKGTLDEAKAALKYYKRLYNRQKILYEANQISADTFDGHERDYKIYLAKVSQAKADLEIKKQNYDNLFIKAPTEGVIISKKIDLGEMVTSQLQATKLFVIAKDLKKMEAEIDIDESDIGSMKEDQEAIFTVDSFPQRSFKSKVKQINYDYKVIDNVISYAVILDVSNPDLSLRPGMTTNVDIKVAEVKNVICVPNKALRINRETLRKIAQKENFTMQEMPKSVENKSKSTLWIAEGKTFKEIHVGTGASNNKYTQVINGINESTSILIEALDPDRENPIINMGKVRV